MDSFNYLRNVQDSIIDLKDAIEYSLDGMENKLVDLSYIQENELKQKKGEYANLLMMIESSCYDLDQKVDDKLESLKFDIQQLNNEIQSSKSKEIDNFLNLNILLTINSYTTSLKRFTRILEVAAFPFFILGCLAAFGHWKNDENFSHILGMTLVASLPYLIFMIYLWVIRPVIDMENDKYNTILQMLFGGVK
jgi:hypothetical protein